MTATVAFDEESNKQKLNSPTMELDFSKEEITIQSRPAASRHQSYDSVPEVNQSWHSPRINMLRLSAAFMGFFINGLKDSTLGLILPKLEKFYGIGYFMVSIAFLAPFVGYIGAALVNDKVHARFGRWGSSCVGAFLELAFYVIASCKPPFPLFVIGYGFAGLGSGLIEGSWNTMCGTMHNSNQLLGILHGFYGIGGAVCSSIGQVMLSKGLPWNYIYYVILSCSGLSLCLSAIAFRTDRAEQYRQLIANKDGLKNESRLKNAVKHRMVVLLAIAVFLYTGGEVSIGGWTTTYMIDVRRGDPKKMGYVSTGYWGGLSIGRIGLGFVTAKIGKLELMVVVYSCLAIIASLVYWLVPELMAGAISAGFIGVLIGPLFPTMMAVAVQKLPKSIQVSGLGFVAAFGGGGAAAVPFIAGAIAEGAGPWAIAPLIFSAFLTMLILWLIIWRFCC